ncbi:hypothetical protein [Mucilaginibacter celer]|uniref:Uncharacterized protein n=1 Tax=Mucilaginibacter celer TaxID=2305508 RepID=A0A494VTE9_9SPHI|nr:hypothetical protein [Mucilaginibacter celer]AYL97341.1 hypothetical protein HYN43_019400 [Mucilaginibacter celer]
MTKENTPLPTTRMVTIDANSFWFYWIACLALYTCNHFRITPGVSIWIMNAVSDYIIIALFLTLFLYLAGRAIKSAEAFKRYNLFCYVFQSVTLLFLIYKVFF